VPCRWFTTQAHPAARSSELSRGQLGIGGAEVEHVVRDGMPHGFYFFPGMIKQGDQAFAAIAAFLKRTGLA
jgi:acetyl esterase